MRSSHTIFPTTFPPLKISTILLSILPSNSPVIVILPANISPFTFPFLPILMLSSIFIFPSASPSIWSLPFTLISPTIFVPSAIVVVPLGCFFAFDLPKTPILLISPF